MSVVTFTQCWLNDVGDPSDYQSFDVKGPDGLVEDPQFTVGSAAYGNTPVYRMSYRPGVQKQAKVAFAAIYATQVTWLKRHIGRPVWFRGPRGEKFAGYYTFDNGLPATNYPNQPYMGVALTVTQITVNDTL